MDSGQFSASGDQHFREECKPILYYNGLEQIERKYHALPRQHILQQSGIHIEPKILPVARMERSEIQDYAAFVRGFCFAPSGLQDNKGGKLGKRGQTTISIRFAFPFAEKRGLSPFSDH